MNEEEAIERLKKDKNKPLACGDITIVNIDDLETVLNLLEKKDIDIIETKEANRQLSIELKKKDKIINLMEDEINKILKDTFERFGLSAYLEKENITVRKFIERKLENGN